MGSVIESKVDPDGSIAILNVEKGQIYKRQFFSSGNFVGIVSNVTTEKRDNANIATIKINSSDTILSPNNKFRTFSNLKFENTSLLIELSLVFFIFHIIFRNNRLLRKLTVVAVLFSGILWIYKNVVLDQIHQYGGVYNAGTAILVILFSLIYFYHQLNKPESFFVYSLPSFWIVIAILLYKAGTFFLFLYSNSLNQTDLANFYLFDSIFYIIQNILFAVAFLIHEKSNRLVKS